jgi:hypothetical protein
MVELILGYRTVVAPLGARESDRAAHLPAPPARA